MMQRLRCLVGRHAVERRKARQTKAGLVSVCKGCGQAMIRRNKGWAIS